MTSIDKSGQVFTSIDKSPGDGEDGVDPLDQQPVGDEGGATGSLSYSWGRGTTPAGADRRNIEQKMISEDWAYTESPGGQVRLYPSISVDG